MRRAEAAMRTKMLAAQNAATEEQDSAMAALATAKDNLKQATAAAAAAADAEEAATRKVFSVFDVQCMTRCCAGTSASGNTRRAGEKPTLSKGEGNCSSFTIESSHERFHRG